MTSCGQKGVVVSARSRLSHETAAIGPVRIGYRYPPSAGQAVRSAVSISTRAAHFRPRTDDMSRATDWTALEGTGKAGLPLAAAFFSCNEQNGVT